MSNKTLDGYPIALPEMDIHTLVNTSQAAFIQKLLAKNPDLPALQLTRRNLQGCVMGMMARLSQRDPFPAEIRAQVRTVQERWHSSTAGDVLHELFDGKLRQNHTPLPHGAPSAGVRLSETQKSSNITTSTASNKGKNGTVVDTERPFNALSVGPCQTLTRVRSGSKPSRSNRLSPYNGNVVVQTPQFLTLSYRKNLIEKGHSLILSLPWENGHTLPAKKTHAHLFDRTNVAESSCRIRLVMASYPSIVLAYDTKIHKDLAAKQIKSLRFQFGHNNPIALEIQDLIDNTASAQARYILGSGFLYFCNYQESLQHFFCNEGFVPVKDVIRMRRIGPMRTELLIRYRFSPEFTGKVTALPGGHRDTRIPAEPPESCSLCSRTIGQRWLQSRPKEIHQPNAKPAPLPRGSGRADTEVFAHPYLKLPGPDFTATYPSLDELKITNYIEALTSLNGVDATKNVQPRLFVRGFNQFLKVCYPDSDFESRLAVLHRIDGGGRLADWEMLCQILRRYFTVEYMYDSKAVSSKRKSLADNDEAFPKRPKRMFATDSF